MFELAAVSISTHHRASPAHFGSEMVATAGLVLVIFSLARTRRGAHRARRCRRLHRRRLLLHELGQLREPRDHDRADVLGHVRRNRAGLGCRASSSRSSSAAVVAVLTVRALYPHVTPAEAADVIVPHGEELAELR